ncbi:MAG TPA: hypothetical protein VG848_00240 [Acetobacteraceae bacterium]|nr:hypothetical protein [Acetobacteraceae bacterium]
MSAEIDSHDTTRLRKMSDLRREDSVIASPAIDQKKGRILWDNRSDIKMREPDAVARHENRLERKIVKHNPLLISAPASERR